MRAIYLLLITILLSCSKPEYTTAVTFVSNYELGPGESMVVFINYVEVGRIYKHTETRECYNKNGFIYELTEGTHLIQIEHSHNKVSMMKRIHIKKGESCHVISI